MMNYKRIIAIVCVIAMLLSTTVSADASKADYKGHWAEKTIDSWITRGYFTVQNAGIQPDKAVTRAEFVSYINKVYKFDEKAEISFKDVKTTDSFYSDVAIAVKAGYIKGDPDGRFNPDKHISRAETAAILARLHKLTVEDSSTILSGFKDKNIIDAWCSGYIAAVVRAGYMKGNGSGFNPKGYLTRAELSTLLDRSEKDYYKLVLNKAGVYDIAAVNGNVLIDAPGVKLNGAKVSGNLLISKNVGDGDVYLNNVEVKGETIINGGGANSIHFVNTILSIIYVDKEGAQVRLVAEGTTRIDKVDISSGAKLEEKTIGNLGFDNVIVSGVLGVKERVILSGEFKTVMLNAKDANVEIEQGKVAELNIKIKTNLLIAGGTVENLTVLKEAEASRLGVDEGATVESIDINAKLFITGTGEISAADINVSGVVTEIKIDTINKTAAITLEIVPPGTIGSVITENSTNPDTTSVQSAAPPLVTVPSVPVTEVTLSSDTAAIEVGKTMQFTAAVAPSDATNKSVLWSSSDTSLAAVNSNGLVTTYHAGTFLLTVTSADNSTIMDTCTVTITPGQALDFQGLQIIKADMRANSFEFENMNNIAYCTNMVVKRSQAPVERPMFDQDFSSVFNADEIIPIEYGQYYAFDGAAGEFIQVYGLDASSRLKQFYQVQLTSDMLSIPAPDFTVVPTVLNGTRRHTIKLSYTSLPAGAAELWIMNVSYEYYHPALGSYSIHGGAYQGLDILVDLGVHVSLAACDASGAILAYHDLVITPELLYPGTPAEIAMAKVEDAIDAGLNTQADIINVEEYYRDAASLINNLPFGALKDELRTDLSHAGNSIDYAKANVEVDPATAACTRANNEMAYLVYTQMSIDMIQPYIDAAYTEVNKLPEGEVKTDWLAFLAKLQSTINDYQQKVNITAVIAGYQAANDASAMTVEELQATGAANVVPENLEAYKARLSYFAETINYLNIERFLDMVNKEMAAIKAVNEATADTVMDVIMANNNILDISIGGDYPILVDKTPVHQAMIGKNFTDLQSVRNAYDQAVQAAFNAQKNDIAPIQVGEAEVLAAQGINTRDEAFAADDKSKRAYNVVYWLDEGSLKADLNARLAVVNDKINTAFARLYITSAEGNIETLGLSTQTAVNTVRSDVGYADSYLSNAAVIGAEQEALRARITAAQTKVNDAQAVLDAPTYAALDAFLQNATIESLLGANTDASHITSSLALTQGTADISVYWSTNNPAISKTGVVTRYLSDKTVTLTLRVIKNGLSRTKTYDFIVLAQ